MTTKSLGNGYKVKDGKLVKVHRYHDASARIRARKSKKVRVVKKGHTIGNDLPDTGKARP